MRQVVTVLEARVPHGGADALRAAYAEAAVGPFPDGLMRSQLLRSTHDPDQWRIETLWESGEHLSRMRTAGKPKGVQMFEDAGAAPALAIFEVVAEISP